MPYNFEEDPEEEENQEEFEQFPLRNMPGQFSNFFNDLSALADAINSVIEENWDDRVKEVGDRVVVWDGSSLISIEGESAYINEEPFTTSKYMIVAAVDQKTRMVSCVSDVEDDVFDIEYLQDLVVIDLPTKQKYRVSSDHVKIYDENE